MTDIDRRTMTLLALLAPLAAATTSSAETPPHAMPELGKGTDRDMSKVPWMGDEEIGMLVYNGMTVMDLIGPHSMFGALMGVKIHIVAKTLDPVISDAGLKVVPDATFESCPRDLTVLFTPGGTDGTIATAKDAETIAFMADRGSRAKYVTSVCSGSLILGSAGLLNGYKATSHWSCRDALAGFGAIPTDARVVRDRNRITGAGVTAGLDFGLSMVAELRDQIYAECTQLMSEYDPHPPFNAGSMHTAPDDVKQAMTEMAAGFRQQAEALSASFRN